MKQLLILSGKGGTGKTTVASSFIRLSETKMYADCDVDAPNLHLITKLDMDPEQKDYFGLPKAEIDSSKCLKCGRCKSSCRFDAIEEKDQKYSVNPFACEGCGVCEEVCPEKAISLKPAKAGDLKLYMDENKTFSTAQLKIGSGTSGKLVTEVKKQLLTNEKPTEVAIIDGSPGIGCPVIASLSGVDMVLIVAEPSISGISDMERIIRTAGIFGTKIAVCVNKYDTNCENTDKIEDFCKDNNIPFIGRIPFDTEAVKAINNGKTIVDVDCKSGEEVRKIYARTMDLLLKK